MRGDNMAYIYKITCDLNQKNYVGKTNLTIEERFKQHLIDAQQKHKEARPLYRAIQKYGKEHFHIEEIEQCSAEEASLKEQYWIGYYKGYEEGYNATLGGDGKLLYDHQAIIEQLKLTPYLKEVANQFSCSTDLVSIIAKANNIKIKNRGQEQLKEQSKIIHQYNKNGDFIQSFSSTVEAATWCFQQGLVSKLYSGVRSHIAEVANGKRKTAYGYIWKY